MDSCVQLTLGLKPGADFGELYVLVRRLGEYVVAEGDEVVLVGERHDTLRIVLGDREECLEDARNALSEAGRKPVHDEMRVLLGHGRVGGGDVVAERDVVERHAERGAVGEVADDHGIGYAAVLMHEHEVGHALRETRLHEILHDRVAAVEADRVGEAETEFLAVSHCSDN